MENDKLLSYISTYYDWTDPDQWIIWLACFLIGISKSGIKGVSSIVVVLLALVFDVKASTGILLPLLIFADIMAVIYYRKYVEWPILIKISGWIIFGVLAGTYIGNELSANMFKKTMSIIIILSLCIMLFLQRKKGKQDLFSGNIFFTSLMGITTGFVTMVGNLAGPVSNVYFLSLRLPKNFFIGTAAWLFLFINIFKVPFHIFIWHTIDTSIVVNDLYLVPFVLIGFIIGSKIVDRIKDSIYRQFIIAMTFIGAIAIFLK